MNSESEAEAELYAKGGAVKFLAKSRGYCGYKIRE